MPNSRMQQVTRQSRCHHWLLPVVLSLIIISSINVSPSQAQTWHNRMFNPLEDGRALGDHYQPFLNNYYSSALPPSLANGFNNNNNQNAVMNQMLTPSTLSNQNLNNNQQVIKPVQQVSPPPPISYDHSITSAAAPSPVAEPLVREPEKQQQTSISMASTTTTTSTSTTAAPDLARYQADQQQQRDSSGAHTNNREQHDNQAASAQLSPVGKIIDSASSAQAKAPDASELTSSSRIADNNKSSNNSTSSGSRDGSKLSSAMQILKAKKQPADGGQRDSVVAVEQQIVKQHARAHHNHPIQQKQHQRLMPTKHRDNKLVSALLGSYSSSASSDASSLSSGDGRNSSPLGSLLSQSLKSMGSTISSRSSIVKAAISDNKLSRTLSSVSKSIGGNKYVAGAAALAALGLTVSKLLGPYIYTNGIGSTRMPSDPLMSSSSYMMPSFASFGGTPLGSSMSMDRNLGFPLSSGGPIIFANPFSSTSSASLSSSAGYQSPSSSHYTDSLTPASSFSSGSYLESPTSSEQQAALANLYASQQQQQQQQQPSLVSDADSQYYISYSPSQVTDTRSKPSSMKAPSFDNTSGHYTNFYSSPDEISSAAEQQQAARQQSFGSFISGQPNGGQSALDGQQQQQENANNRYSKLLTSGSSIASATLDSGNSHAGDQIMQQASNIDAPSYLSSSSPSVKFYFPSSQQSRRSGSTVSIKLDEATKARLQERLHSMRSQQQEAMPQNSDYTPSSYYPPSSTNLADKQYGSVLASASSPTQITDKYQLLIPTSSSADSSSNYASFAKWTPTSSSQPQQFVPATTSERNRLASGANIDKGQQSFARMMATSLLGQQQQLTHLDGGQKISDNSKAQQAGSTTYLIIRPKTNSNDNSFAQQMDQQQQWSNDRPKSWPRDNFYHYQTAAQQAASNGWRSLSAPSSSEQASMQSNTMTNPDDEIAKQTNHDHASIPSTSSSLTKQQQLHQTMLASSQQNLSPPITMANSGNEDNELQRDTSLPVSLHHRVSRTTPQAIKDAKINQQRSYQNKNNESSKQSDQLASSLSSEVFADSESSSADSLPSPMLAESSMINLIQENGNARVSAGLQQVPANKQQKNKVQKSYSARDDSIESDNPNNNSNNSGSNEDHEENNKQSLSLPQAGSRNIAGSTHLMSLSSSKKMRQQPEITMAVGGLNNEDNSSELQQTVNGQQVASEVDGKQPQQQKQTMSNSTTQDNEEEHERGKSGQQQQQVASNEEDDHHHDHQQRQHQPQQDSMTPIESERTQVFRV